MNHTKSRRPGTCGPGTCRESDVAGVMFGSTTVGSTTDGSCVKITTVAIAWAKSARRTWSEGLRREGKPRCRVLCSACVAAVFSVPVPLMAKETGGRAAAVLGDLRSNASQLAPHFRATPGAPSGPSSPGRQGGLPNFPGGATSKQKSFTPFFGRYTPGPPAPSANKPGGSTAPSTLKPSHPVQPQGR